MPWPAKHFQPNCEWSDTPISYRCKWQLEHHNITTRAQILEIGKEGVKRWYLIGPKTLAEIGRLVGRWSDEPPAPIDYLKVTRDFVEGGWSG